MLERDQAQSISVTTIADLIVLSQSLFARIGLPLDRAQMSDLFDHGVRFEVPGKAKAVMERLQAETGSEGWDYEAGNGFYRHDTENWCLYLRSTPGAVLCMATVISLHAAYLARLTAPS